MDESQQRRVEEEARQLAEKREKVSQASGTLITAALSLAGELIGNGKATSPSEETVNRLTDELAGCVDRNEQGRPQLKITLPNEDALQGLAKSLATLLES